MYDSQTEENNCYNSIIIEKTVWNAILEFLRYEIEKKMVSLHDATYTQ